jgi:Bacterial SH3 domain.
MKSKDEFLNQLIDNRLMANVEQIELYEESVKNLFNEEDIAVIDLLILGFLDTTENDEVMFSTLHGIEFFSKKVGLRNYILKIIPLLKQIETDAYDWSETVFLRLINNQEALNILGEEINFFTQNDQVYLTKILTNLVKRNPKRFEEKGNFLLSKIVLENDQGKGEIYKTYQGKDYTKEEWIKFEDEEYRKYVENRGSKKSTFMADEKIGNQNFSAETDNLKEVQYFVMNAKQDKVPIYEFPSTMVAPFTFLLNGTAIDIIKYEKNGWCEILSKEGKNGFIQSNFVKKND